MKSANPEFPFIVRECLNAQPSVMARYDYGVERRVYLHNASEAEVSQAITELVEQASEVNQSDYASRFWLPLTTALYLIVYYTQIIEPHRKTFKYQQMLFSLFFLSFYYYHEQKVKKLESILYFEKN